MWVKSNLLKVMIRKEPKHSIQFTVLIVITVET